MANLMDSAAVNRLENLFNEYVPSCGMAETEGGEMVRAMMRILYRWWNDGDMVGVFYGIETVNSSYGFLMDRVANWPAFGGEECPDDVYESQLERALLATLEHLDNNPDLFKEKASRDSRKSTPEDWWGLMEEEEDEYEEEW